MPRRSKAVGIQSLSPDEWRLFRELRLAALRDAPYAFETRLAQWQGSGDTEQRWRDRLTGVPFNVVAYLDDVPVGIVSATEPDENGATELISMFVAPAARRKGVGRALIEAVVSWARTQGLERVTLGVRETNASARALYERCGFIDAGRMERRGPPERRITRTA